MSRRLVLLPVLALTLTLLVQPSQAHVPYAQWTEHTFASGDGTVLHADVLRPFGAKGRTPVILSVGPYFGHWYQDAAGSGISNTDPLSLQGSHPSKRFEDFQFGAKVFERGYTFVMVHLRGSGESGGCLDLLGPGEAMDVKAAVEWAARQPWSTGKVGLYGKSYDAETGLVAAALRPKGLAAVVAQEAGASGYDGVYANGVPDYVTRQYPNLQYGVRGEMHDETQGDLSEASLAEDQRVYSHSADCQIGLAGWQLNDPSSAFWRDRDYLVRGKGSTVPTLLTVGFLDGQTKPSGRALEFWQNLRGPKRLWVGPWRHYRGNELDNGRLAMGRAGWFDEVMRWYDHFLKGAPVSDDPAVVLQSAPSGTWTAERTWPPTTRPLSLPLAAGSYVDDGLNEGSAKATEFGPGSLGYVNVGDTRIPGSRTGSGVWTQGPVLASSINLAGKATLTLDLAVQVPDTNVAVDLYDVAPDHKAVLVSRQASLVDTSGRLALELWAQDWVFAKGHRIGFAVSGSNNENWLHTPTGTTVTVRGGTLTLPVRVSPLGPRLAGNRSPYLETWLKEAVVAAP